MRLQHHTFGVKEENLIVHAGDICLTFSNKLRFEAFVAVTRCINGRFAVSLLKRFGDVAIATVLLVGGAHWVGCNQDAPQARSYIYRLNESFAR